MSDSFDLSTLYDEFRDEARQQLARLDAALLRLEQTEELPEDERSALLRSLHTLKGNSGMLGLHPVVDAVHAVEAAFKAAPERWSQPALDALFETAAALRRVVDRLGTSRQDEALRRLEGVNLPAAQRGPPEAAGAEQAAGRSEPDADPDGLGESGDTLRVSFHKLDALLNRVGELVSAGAVLEATLAREEEALEAVGARRTLEAQVEGLQQAMQQVRDSTMELRLVPVGRLLQRFPGMVRDLARAQGKRVRVELKGEGVELDKSTVDALAEPLLHLVRNAVDHGIGTPAEREAAGKPPSGVLTLSAAQEGDRVRVEVADDGAGLDRGAILARARESGLLERDESPPREEIDELIFRPGFSTRREATTVSGRGVGLDVVRRRITALRGSLEVRSEPGEGTRFLLRLPLTVAIVPALVFESGGERLALPAAEVEEMLRRVRLERAGAAEVVRHRDELVAVARPQRLFGWKELGPEENGARPFAIILRRGSRAAAVVAERLVEQRSIVVKALPRYLGAPRGVAGATVTPDGRVLLLLDVGGLLDMNLETHRRRNRAG